MDQLERSIAGFREAQRSGDRDAVEAAARRVDRAREGALTPDERVAHALDLIRQAERFARAADAQR